MLKIQNVQSAPRLNFEKRPFLVPLIHVTEMRQDELQINRCNKVETWNYAYRINYFYVFNKL